MLPPDPGPENILEGPMDGLSKDQMGQFVTGDEAFGKVYSVADGLGPVFIQNACTGCHAGDGKGHPSNMVIRFGKSDSSSFDFMTDKGGFQLQPQAINGFVGEVIPSDANRISKRLAPLITGLGFIAALHDSSIMANADPDDLNGDGISGRINYVAPSDFFVPKAIHISKDGKFAGRFGKKAFKPDLTEQVVFALKNDIGITSDFDMEDPYNSLTGEHTIDNVADPELSAGAVRNIVFYLRTLKIPPRRNENDPQVIEGAALFANTGCAACHISEFKTAKSDLAALSEKSFAPYSDFLLHDMGDKLDDGFPEGDAQSNEWRTPPLWGLGLANTTQGGKIYLLHDGRAGSIQEAIAFHGGEATTTKDAFFALPSTDQEKIIKFLESL